VIGEFQKRYGDGKIQVKTHNGRTVERKETFPYGFYAKAKGGRAFVFCRGGNLDGFEICPVQAGEGVMPPELEEGDAALYTGGGGWIVVREAGGIEINAEDAGDITVTCRNGKFYFGNNSKNLCELLVGLIDEIEAIVTFGGPPIHTIHKDTKQKLELYKAQVKALLLESK
jgi:hypothetical protein